MHGLNRQQPFLNLGIYCLEKHKRYGQSIEINNLEGLIITIPIVIESDGLNKEAISQALEQFIGDKQLSKVLLVPPDSTRSHSGAGLITSLLYNLLITRGVIVHILPALGTHAPMTPVQLRDFFGDIPVECYINHRWRDGVTAIGEISASFLKDASEGFFNESVSVEVADALLDPSYDLIISIGQVVPHEVVGMANYSKNILVGCGGSKFINCSHMLGASYGVERTLGNIDTPVRKLFDYAQRHFLSKLPLEYVLTVTETTGGQTNIIGLYIGGGRSAFEQACSLSQRRNIIHLDRPIQKCIVWLNEDEFHSTWLGNKAIYRTRKAIADGGQLIVLAPGVKSFGEDAEIDRLVRKYGYVGRERILSLCKTEKELQSNLSAAAHLIHGSSDGRFEVTYAAPLIGRDAVEGVGYKYADLAELKSHCNLQTLSSGYNILPNGDEIYFIPNPALGLWEYKAGE